VVNKTAGNHGMDDLETAAQEGAGLIGQFLDDSSLGAPGRYYAVLAMDGDGMGRWLSGENFGGVLTRNLHERLSRGLGRSALEHIKPIIEDPWELGKDQPQPYQGKVIYAGADDVLALLPGEQALACARAIHDVFKRVMSEEVPSHLRSTEFGISAGIAIGHIKEPLQDMVEAAFAELRRAKDGFGGDAVAVALFKRSGEQIEWGARFDSAAFPLLALFQKYFRVPADETERRMPISGRFPHRLSELLVTYDLGPRMTAGLREVALAGLEYMLPRQVTRGDIIQKPSDLGQLQLELRLRAEAYARELELLRRSPEEFYHLFNVEDFLTRDLR
jgi:hypothetical protein